MWSDLGLILAIVAAWSISRMLYQDIFTPLFSYIAVWCGALAFFRLRLVNYDELETRTVFLIGGSMVAFKNM